MAEINLLPWRENLRNTARKEFLIVFVTILGVVGVILLILFNMLNSKVRHQQARNTELQQNITILEPKMAEITAIKLELNNLNAKQIVLEKLQLQSSHIAPLLEQIAAQMPSELYLTRLDKKEQQLTFEGIAESNARVSELMQRIIEMPGMIEPHLEEMKSADSKKRGKEYIFKMTAQNVTAKNS
jgi:type IV pilus assembly protein PilN